MRASRNFARITVGFVKVCIFHDQKMHVYLILHEVKRASEASEASRSEMVEISHSLQLCITFPTHIGKKFFLPPIVVQGSFGHVCLCVCASVCLCVCPSPRKSALTFEPGNGSARKFQGRPYSRRVIFGRVTRTPDPSGPGPDPE